MVLGYAPLQAAALNQPLNARVGARLQVCF